MQRKETWPEDLHEHFLGSAHKPFCWGNHDCLLHVCDAIHAMTGIDPAQDFRGQYSDMRGALKQCKKHGGENFEHLVEVLAEKHGLNEISPKYAQRGDVVLFDTEEGPAFGIVHHNGIESVCVGPEGLRRIRTLLARRAWRVGATVAPLHNPQTK